MRISKVTFCVFQTFSSHLLKSLIRIFLLAIAVLQHVGFPARHFPLRGRHVPHGLGHRAHHIRLRWGPLLLHQLQKTRYITVIITTKI